MMMWIGRSSLFVWYEPNWRWWYMDKVPPILLLLILQGRLHAIENKDRWGQWSKLFLLLWSKRAKRLDRLIESLIFFLQTGAGDTTRVEDLQIYSLSLQAQPEDAGLPWMLEDDCGQVRASLSDSHSLKGTTVRGWLVSLFFSSRMLKQEWHGGARMDRRARDFSSLLLPARSRRWGCSDWSSSSATLPPSVRFGQDVTAWWQIVEPHFTHARDKDFWEEGVRWRA